MFRIFGRVNKILGIVFDIDGTVYGPDEDGPYMAHALAGLFDELSSVLRLDRDQIEKIFSSRREELTVQSGRKATLTEVMYDFGVEPLEWDRLRIKYWSPEQFIAPKPELVPLFVRLERIYGDKIIFGTNSPREVGEKILRCIGLPPEFVANRVCGPRTFAAQKPDKDFFVAICEHLKTAPSGVVAIGDRVHADIEPALEAGLVCGVHVPNGPIDLQQVLDCILNNGCLNETDPVV